MKSGTNHMKTNNNTYLAGLGIEPCWMGGASASCSYFLEDVMMCHATKSVFMCFAATLHTLLKWSLFCGYVCAPCMQTFVC
jgi:hypothetical protein